VTMSEHDPFDLNLLRADPTDPNLRPKSTTTTTPKAKWRKQFVRVPWTWLDRLKTARHVVTYRIAFYLLYQHWRTGGKPITLSNVALIGEGIAPGTKWRGLKELEQAGLIQVERRRRKSPIVTLFLTEGR
jgi:hypothetical protein